MSSGNRQLEVSKMSSNKDALLNSITAMDGKPTPKLITSIDYFSKLSPELLKKVVAQAEDWKSLRLTSKALCVESNHFFKLNQFSHCRFPSTIPDLVELVKLIRHKEFGPRIRSIKFGLQERKHHPQILFLMTVALRSLKVYGQKITLGMYENRGDWRLTPKWTLQTISQAISNSNFSPCGFELDMHQQMDQRLGDKFSDLILSSPHSIKPGTAVTITYRGTLSLDYRGENDSTLRVIPYGDNNGNENLRLELYCAGFNGRCYEDIPSVGIGLDFGRLGRTICTWIQLREVRLHRSCIRYTQFYPFLAAQSPTLRKLELIDVELVADEDWTVWGIEFFECLRDELNLEYLTIEDLKSFDYDEGQWYGDGRIVKGSNTWVGSNRVDAGLSRYISFMEYERNGDSSDESSGEGDNDEESEDLDADE